MSLLDFYDPDGGGQYLGEGQHDVSIVGMRDFTCNSGSKGIEFEIEGYGGRKSSISFVLHPKSMWKLANFALACGLTQQQMQSIDPDTGRGFNLFLHRRFVAVMTPKEYTNKKGEPSTIHECTDFLPLEIPNMGSGPAPSATKAAPAPNTPATDEEMDAAGINF